LAIIIIQKKRKKIILIFLVLIFFLFFSTVNIVNIHLYSDNDNKKHIRVAASRNLAVTPIEIDDTDITKNWSYTALTYDWCYGSGTWNDPFIIENVFINAFNMSNCIYIKNSEVFFIIRNCTLINSTTTDYITRHAGIHLNNVKNGRIYNNTCLFNNEVGILLDRSFNNTIRDCRINNNKNYGIQVSLDRDPDNGNNTVRDCTLNNNGYGIEIVASDNNKIIGNTIFNCSEDGITVWGTTYNNSFINNTITHSSDNGFETAYIYDYKIIANEIHSNGGSGLNIYNGSRLLITSNNFTSNKDNAIYIRSGFSNVINSNYIMNSYWGILHYGYYSLISNNLVYDCKAVGIGLLGNYHSNISYNTVERSEDWAGIGLNGCNNITIYGNILDYNINGIDLLHSDNITIEKNHINWNIEAGIFLELCYFSNITKNSINYNGIGIHLMSCINTTISNNHLYCNDVCMTLFNSIGTVLISNSCMACEESILGFDVIILMGIIGFTLTILIKKKKT